MNIEKIKKNFTLGQSNFGISYDKGIILKKIKINEEYIFPSTKLNEANYSFIPNYLVIEKDYVKYEYELGNVKDKVRKISDINLKILAKMIKEINQNINKDSDVHYVHGDINPMNLIYNTIGKVIKIIDWDSLHISKLKHEDIFYTMWTCINIGSHKFKTEK